MIDLRAQIEAALDAASVLNSTGLKIVGTFEILDYGGRPNAAAVWLIVATDSERAASFPRRHFIESTVRGLLQNNGYPPSALPTVMVRVASQEAINAAGGSANYFR